MKSKSKARTWVYVSEILGTDKIPADAGLVMKMAINKGLNSGDITHRNAWQLFEYLAADYLSR